MAGQYDKQGYVPARQAENRYLVSLKDLQIRALDRQDIERNSEGNGPIVYIHKLVYSTVDRFSFLQAK